MRIFAGARRGLEEEEVAELDGDMVGEEWEWEDAVEELWEDIDVDVDAGIISVESLGRALSIMFLASCTLGLEISISV